MKVKSFLKKALSVCICVSLLASFAGPFALCMEGENIYNSYIGCTATFNIISGDETYLVTESEPDDSWGEQSLLFRADEIPSDLMLEIVSSKIITEKFEDFDENGGTKLVERQSLWYQVKKHSGTMPVDFSDGYWVMQNYLNKEDAYEHDALIIHPKKTVAIYDASGNKVESVAMPQFSKPEFTAESALGDSALYQWQIQSKENNWIDIYGETSKTVKLSYGMLASLLNDSGVAYIRCKSTYGIEVSYSKVIPVTVEMYQPKEPDIEVSESFVSSNGQTVTVTVTGSIPENATVELEETDSTDVDVNPSETIVAALDISIMHEDGTLWQPEAGETVTVTLEASSIGLKTGDEFVVYHLHNGEVRVLGSYKVVNDTVSFEVDGFSKFVFALAEQVISSEDYEVNIGKTATINDDYENFDAYTDPRSGEYPVGLLQGKDYSEGIEFTIKGVYVSNTFPYSIYYQVEVKSGEIYAEEFATTLWIYQGHQAEDSSWGTLVIHEHAVDEEPKVEIEVDGQQVTEITVSANNKITLTATPTISGNTGYKWQILIPDNDMWVDISSQTENNCTVNYGMVANRLDESGQAHIRCVTSVDGKEIISEPIAVNIASSYVLKNSVRNYSATSNAAYAVAPAAEDDTTIYNVVINYVYENGKTAETSFTSTVGVTGHLSRTVVFPTILGYLPYVDDARMDEYVFDLKGSDMTQDFVMNVVYKPTLVDYTVVVMQQNVHNDGYTEFERKTLQALTGTVIAGDMQVDISYPGFYQLLHNQVTVAADGSTVIEVRFDRYYYLMTFDLGEGGYGVLPVYARCGTEAQVDSPTRPGYVFTHWTNPQGETVESPLTMPTYDTVITAHWTPSTAKYSVVYWKENADPNSDGTYGYTYWGSRIIDSVSGTVVSGSDDIPTFITNATVDGKTVDEKKYFTYNDSLTDKNVVVKGDGSTVVNVYYTRNYYTIYFKGYGECCHTEHTHGAGCNSKLICTLEEHTHDSTCEGTLSCSIPAHSAHDADCLICGKVEHTAHTDDCLQCEHTHNQISCYTTNQNLQRATTLSGNNKTAYDRLIELMDETSPQNATVYRIYRNRNNTNTIYNFFFFEDVWYFLGTNNIYSGILRDGNTPKPSKDNYASVAAKVSCRHTHDESCYKDKLHEHISSCYKDVIHTHSESCYNYSCGKVTHGHGTGCYSDCTLTEHTHTNTCTTNSTSNVVHVITAKYEANIADQWPTYDKLAADGYHYTKSNGDVVNGTSTNASKFRGWDIEGVDNEAVSKRLNMTEDLCDTSDGEKDADAQYSGSYTYRLYYMFESFDQTSPANGTTRKQYKVDGKDIYFDSDLAYYQELVYNSDTTFNQKQVLGMKPVGTEKSSSGGIIYNWLYYTRNRSSLQYQNIDTIIDTKSNIMYGESLNGYMYAGTPPYPVSLEEGAYEFAGWYTTAGCYDGTEVNFDTATMPNGDMVLYAKWEPVTHTVQFYTQKDESGNLSNKIGDTYAVKHNQKLNEQYIPQASEDFENGAYSFNGWWYMDGNTEQRFDFKSLPVTRDLVVYAKWTSNKLIPYEFHFQLADGTPVADSVSGSDLAGNTITLDAKGGANLYPQYQKGFFPNTTSHSLTLNIDNEDDVLSFTFVYTLAEAVPYTVYYVAETLKDGATSLGTITLGNKNYYSIVETKNVSDNQLAYVSENFVSVPGYVPDEFQKNLVIVPGRENIIVFYYTVDEKNAPYKVTHYTQNLDGETWTVEYTYTGIAVIDSSYSENPMTNLVGFTYDESLSKSSGTVSEEGLELNLYYVRNRYPYKVVYKLQSTGDIIYTSDTETEMYGKVVSATALNEYKIYSLVSNATQTTTIRVEEDPNNLTLNIITFFYEEKEVTISYEVVGPNGCGTVSPENETLRLSSASAMGSEASPSSTVYKFVGWYSDEACTNLLLEDFKFVPTKEDGKGWVATTYYAKFEWGVAPLTISKQGWEPIDADQSFIFDIIGKDDNTKDIALRVVVHGNESVTINDLPLGKYEVLEVSDWSWRYNVTNTNRVQVVVLDAESKEIPFVNVREKQYWLDGNAFRDNRFAVTKKSDEEGDDTNA